MTLTARFTHNPDLDAPTEYRLHNRTGQRVKIGPQSVSESGHNIITITFPDGFTDEAFAEELTEWRLSA